MKGKQILLSERGRIECYLISQLFSSTIDIHFFFVILFVLPMCVFVVTGTFHQ